MAAITAAVSREYKGGPPKQKRVLMTASTTIPKGAIVAVAAATGLAINAVAGTVNPVVGIASETLTSAASGDYWIQVQYDAEWRFAASSITQAMVGEPMLVIDNNTVDETSATSAVVGILTEFISTTEGYVYVPGDTVKSVL